MTWLGEWRSIYARVIGLYDNAPEVEVEITSDVREKPRHFADVELSRPVVLRLHPELISGNITRLRGVLAHEAGHILDLSLMGDQEFRAVCRRLGYPYTTDRERRADILAEWVTGWTIYYDGDLVQRAGPGARGTTPRPTRLR